MPLTSNRCSLFYPPAAVLLIILAFATPSPGAPIEGPILSLRPEEGGAKKSEIDVSTKELVVLYRNEENHIIERLSLRGELAIQWAAGTSDRGSYGSWDLPENTRWAAIDVRRWRLGFESKWVDSVKLWGAIEINPELDPFYKDIYELAASYSRSEELALSVGKIKSHYFSQEYNTPSRELLVFEQSLIVDTLIPRQLTAAWINGKAGKWVYALAAYAGDYETEFSKFDAGAVIQSSLGYDFASVLNMDKALVVFDYQGSTSSKNSDGPGKFGSAFSLNTTFQSGSFYGYTDILGGIGRDNQGDVWGVVLTPTYFLILNKLQAVLRYQYAHGGDSGLNLPQRYEGLATDIQSTKGAGSDYNAIYLGLIYYIYRHNFKLMTGVQYSDMTGGKLSFSGWTYLAGVRLAF
jgi:phosphate-selective porin OprO and OprP